MLQHYVLASAGLFFAYWSGVPVWTYALLLSLHVVLFGASQAPIIDESSLEFAAARPLSLLFACGIAGLCTWLIRKTRLRWESASFAARQLVAAALW